MLGETLADLIPLALGLAFFPIILLTALFLLASEQGRRKDAAFMLGLVTGAFAFVGLLVAAGEAIGHPLPSHYRTIFAGGVTLIFGLYFLSIAAKGIRTLHKGQATFRSFGLPGIRDKFDHTTPAEAFGKGLKAAVWNARAPLVNVSAAAIIIASPLRFGQAAVATAVFAVMVGVGSAVLLGLVALPGGRGERTVDRYSDWMEAHGGAFLVVACGFMGLVLLSKSIRLLL